MNHFWTGFIATRYMGRRERGSPSNVLAVLGIFTGVLALIVIIAVMNGFQLGFIESIVEVSSYHIRMEDITGEEAIPALVARIRALPGVKVAMPFREVQALVRGRRETPQVALIRGLPPDALEHDGGMAAKLEFSSGTFDLDAPGSIILGAELALRLGLRPGDTMRLLSINGAGFLERLDTPPDGAGTGIAAGEGPDAPDSRFQVTGIFRTGYYEYDLGWGFINTESARTLLGGDDRLSLGIKLGSRWQDARILAEIMALPAYRSLAETGRAGPVRPWRDYNRAFYGALRTEKLLMFILVGLIFIVVGLNIFQAQRRQVLERREEIGLLRAVGSGAFAVRLIFLWDGLIIGLLGAAGGLAAGLLIAGNIAAFFGIIEGAVNAVLGLAGRVAGFFGPGRAGHFAVFSPAVFYLKEIPARIIPHEVALICLFGVFSALFAAWFASGRVSRTNPAEVLRYE